MIGTWKFTVLFSILYCMFEIFHDKFALIISLTLTSIHFFIQITLIFHISPLILIWMGDRTGQTLKLLSLKMENTVEREVENSMDCQRNKRSW